ncbi:hypothetical protein V6N13_120588 [Hibiscus sabdariffa]
MDIPQEIDDYIKGTVDDSLGLQVSPKSLQLKLRTSEETQRRLREQYLFLLSKLKERDQIIERSKAESNMNAVALKRFVQENQKLAEECANLLTQCNKWERECLLYDHDREALMDFGNEADERAKKAEIRVHELEKDLGKLNEDLRDIFGYFSFPVVYNKIDSSSEGTTVEENLLDSVLSTLICKDGVTSGRAFLEANTSLESCQRLRPSTKKVLSLAAEVKTLKKDKEHLRLNLSKAEEEVKVLFEENMLLDEANRRLLRQSREGKNLHDSGGKLTGSAKLSMHDKTRNWGLAFVSMASRLHLRRLWRLSLISNHINQTKIFFEYLFNQCFDGTCQQIPLWIKFVPKANFPCPSNDELVGRALRLNYAKAKKKKLPKPEKAKPVPVFNLFVANLSYEARSEHLKEFFSSDGANVVAAEVIIS